MNNPRVPVLNPDGTPAMPTKASRARRWVRDGLAIGKWNDLGVYYVQLKAKPSDIQTQPIALGCAGMGGLQQTTINCREQKIKPEKSPLSTLVNLILVLGFKALRPLYLEVMLYYLFRELRNVLVLP